MCSSTHLAAAELSSQVILNQSGIALSQKFRKGKQKADPRYLNFTKGLREIEITKFPHEQNALKAGTFRWTIVQGISF